MKWLRDIADLRREVRIWLDMVPGMIFGWTLTAASSALGDEDAVQTADGESDQREVRRVEPWGVRGRPPNGVRALWLRWGTSNVFLIGFGSNGKYGPTNLEAGESALYGIADATFVKVAKDGRVVALAGDHVELGDEGLGPKTGVMTGELPDPSLGIPFNVLYGWANPKVRAKKSS